MNCTECKCPVNSSCDCGSCSSTPEYCHVCREMFRAAVRNPFISKSHDEWKREQDSRRNRMGL